MTKAEIYTFVTNLLDGFEIDTTLFDTFLNTAQSYWENQRPWMALRAEDSSNTISPGNTFTTVHTLPTNFRKWYTRFPIVLADSQQNPQQYLREVPFNSKLAYKSDGTRFYCDYANRRFYICGEVPQALTAYLYFIKKGTLVSADDNNEWELDTLDEYTEILGLTVAVYWKNGVDYDVINNAQANANASLAGQIFKSMTEWDGELQESAIQGQDYGSDAGWLGNASGGRIQF